jgi:hypothetical protein
VARARASCVRRARAVAGEYAFFLAVLFDVAARAGVFEAVFGAAATVWAIDDVGAKVSADATITKDTASFVKQFGFAMKS